MTAQWKVSLLGCMSYSNTVCIDACLCPACMLGRIQNAADKTNPKLDEPACGMLPCLCVCAMCCACSARRSIAEKYNIDEGCLGATCKGVLCCSCTICQTHAELTSNNYWPGGTCMHKEPVPIDMIGRPY